MATRRIAGAELRILVVVSACALAFASCKPKIDRSIGFGTGSWAYPASLDSVVPPPAQAVIARVEGVEIALVDPQADGPGEPFGPPPHLDWRLRSPWKRATMEDVHGLRQLLLERTSWQTERKTCTFDPGIAIRWIQGPDTSGALVCLMCDEMIGWTNGTRFNGQMDPSSPRWLAWAKRAFPEDAAMQDFVAEQGPRTVVGESHNVPARGR